MATPAEFAAVRPRLFHMAEPDAWESIRRHGLLSTSSALDLHGVRGPEREALEARRRPATVRLEHPVHGRLALRDQHPLNERALERCLTGGLRPADWHALLNARAFLWADEARLRRMLRTYRAAPNLVLTIDAAAFLQAHAARIEATRINTGAPFPMKPAPRGRESFVPLADLPVREIPRVVEVTVLGGAPDFARFVIHRAITPAYAPGDPA